jgi:DNA replication protein DnaC
MSNEIIVALIMAIGTILVQIISSIVSKRSTTAIINYRVGELEKKVDKHNQLYDRTVVLETEMKEVRCDIEKLEKKGV